MDKQIGIYRTVTHNGNGAILCDSESGRRRAAAIVPLRPGLQLHMVQIQGKAAGVQLVQAIQRAILQEPDGAAGILFPPGCIQGIVQHTVIGGGAALGHADTCPDTAGAFPRGCTEEIVGMGHDGKGLIGIVGFHGMEYSPRCIGEGIALGQKLGKNTARGNAAKCAAGQSDICPSGHLQPLHAAAGHSQVLLHADSAPIAAGYNEASARCADYRNLAAATGSAIGEGESTGRSSQVNFPITALIQGIAVQIQGYGRSAAQGQGLGKPGLMQEGDGHLAGTGEGSGIIECGLHGGIIRWIAVHGHRGHQRQLALGAVLLCVRTGGVVTVDTAVSAAAAFIKGGAAVRILVVTPYSSHIPDAAAKGIGAAILYGDPCAANGLEDIACWQHTAQRNTEAPLGHNLPIGAA